MARPENWEVFRSYAEKLLDRPIAATYDEGVIAEDRKQLRDLFAAEKEFASHIQAQASDLFSDLGIPQPYETEVGQAARLFATDLSGGDDIQLILHGLKEAYGYRAFDDNQADSREVDDLANRLRNYRDVRRFLGYERDLRTAHAYCQLAIPEGSDWKVVRRLQRDDLAKKLTDLRPFIDSDARFVRNCLATCRPNRGRRALSAASSTSTRHSTWLCTIPCLARLRWNGTGLRISSKARRSEPAGSSKGSRL